MKNLCSSGHLSRLINVMTGFEDNPKGIEIKMNVQDEIYANISNYLNKKLKEEKEEVIDSMMSQNKELYIMFVIDKMKPKIVELIDGYKNITKKDEVIKEVEISLKKYLQDNNSLKLVMSEILK